MASETMKEYLVKIGWDVDKEGFDNTMSLVNDVAGKLSGKAAGIAYSFVKASGIVVDALITVNESLVSVVEETAKLDYETEKLARQYWTTEQNARSFSTALDVLGENTSDLMYMTQEQYKRFIELNRLGKTLEAPNELDTYLTKVRGLNFEVSRLKMIFQYGTRWVTYWISQFTGEDVENFTGVLRRLGDYIIKNIQPITKAIAKFFEIFYKLAKAAIKLITTLGKVIKNVVDLLDSQISRTILLVAALSKALFASPITMIIGAILALLLLIDDYMGWKRGIESALDWSAFDDALSDLKSAFNDLNDAVQPLKDALDHIWNDIFGDLSPLDILQKRLDGIADVIVTIASAIDTVRAFIDDFKNFGEVVTGKKSFSDYWNNDFGKVGSSLGNFLEKAAGVLSKAVRFTSPTSALMHYGIDSLARSIVNNQTNNVTVYGSDAKSIGDEVAGRLTKNFPTRLPY